MVKSYFGDVETMIWSELLCCYVVLVAVGTKSCYEDGIWLDVSYRIRFLVFFWCVEGCFISVVQSFLVTFELLDDLMSVIAVLEIIYIDATIWSVGSMDVGFFVFVCCRFGKLVCFVFVIDVDLCCWYKFDSFW